MGGKSGKKVAEVKTKKKERKGKWEDNRFVIINFDILSEYKIPESRSKENTQIKALSNSPMLQYIKNKKSLIN